MAPVTDPKDRVLEDLEWALDLTRRKKLGAAGTQVRSDSVRALLEHLRWTMEIGRGLSPVQERPAPHVPEPYVPPEPEPVPEPEPTPPETPSVYRRCKIADEATLSIPSFTTVGTTYDVKRSVTGDWSCTCPHHKIRAVICKHISSAQGQYSQCNWNQLLDGGEALAPTHACPRCGGETIPYTQ